MRDEPDHTEPAAAAAMVPRGPLRAALLAAAGAAGRVDPLVPLAAWLIAVLRPRGVALAGLGDGSLARAVLRAQAAEGLAVRCTVPDDGSALPPALAGAEADGIDRAPAGDWPGTAEDMFVVADLGRGAEEAAALAALAAPSPALIGGEAPDAPAPPSGRAELRLPGIEDARLLFAEDHAALGPLAAMERDDPGLVALGQLMRAPVPGLTEEEAAALLGIHRGGGAGAMIARGYALAHHARDAETARQAEGRARAELWRVRRERDEAHARVDALLNSRSWRALEPARRVARRVRGHPRGGDGGE